MTIESTLDEFKIQEKQIVEQLIEFPEKLPENPETYQFKLVVCGDPMVGKTSLILKYVKRVFQRSYLPTLGVSVSSKLIQVEDALVQLVLWDIAGQQKFQTMRTSFYNGARGVLLVFDLTRSETFQSMNNWFQDITNNIKGEPFLIGFVIGNKNDLNKARKVSNTEAIELVSNLNLEYFETSALTGENVDNAFTSLASKLLQESRNN
jgi:small GTP-binding protein